MEEFRECNDCKTTKAITEFHKKGEYGGRQYYQHRCKACTSLWKAKRRKADRAMKGLPDATPVRASQNRVAGKIESLEPAYASS